MKLWSSIGASSYTLPLPGQDFNKLWIYTTWGCLHTKITNHDPATFEDKVSKVFPYIFPRKTLWPHPTPGSIDIKKKRIYTTWGYLPINITNHSLAVHKKIVKDFSNTCSIYSQIKLFPLWLLSLHPTFGSNKLNKLYFALSGDTCLLICLIMIFLKKVLR